MLDTFNTRASLHFKQLSQTKAPRPHRPDHTIYPPDNPINLVIPMTYSLDATRTFFFILIRICILPTDFQQQPNMKFLVNSLLTIKALHAFNGIARVNQSPSNVTYYVFLFMKKNSQYFYVNCA